MKILTFGMGKILDLVLYTGTGTGVGTRTGTDNMTATGPLLSLLGELWEGLAPEQKAPTGAPF